MRLNAAADVDALAYVEGMGAVVAVKEINPAALRQVGDLTGQMFRVLIHALSKTHCL
ncbi:hypothetical protein D3C80_676570 [compost metagenome]